MSQTSRTFAFASFIFAFFLIMQPVLADTLPERVLGNGAAPVTIYDYSSLTCPHCADFHSRILPEIKKRAIDTGKAKLIFRDFPLDKPALQASVLAHCATLEPQFYPLLDVLFQSQEKVGAARLIP